MHPFERRLRASLTPELLGQRRLLIAVSGGPDSLALLLGLAALRERLDLRLSAVSFEQGWRPEGWEDVALASAAAQAQGVELWAMAVRGAGAGPEDAARRARLRALRSLAQRLGCDRIALGHQAGDQAETILWRIVSGGPWLSLEGIRPFEPLRPEDGEGARELALIRPMLGLERAEVEAYLGDRGVTPARDASNAELGLLRNRLRLEVLPALRAINPRVDEGLRRLGEELGELRSWMAERRRDLRELGEAAAGWPLAELRRWPRAELREALRAELRAAGLRPIKQAQLEALLELVARGRGEVALAGGRRARCEAGRLRLG